MEMAVFLDYKPTRYEGKRILRNLNIRIHRDITGERCGLGCGVVTANRELRYFPKSFINHFKQFIRQFRIKPF